ncbi:MAG: hypothetical protein IPJ48_13145 [Propionivibrio sp.]|uniref:Uncharacterized protein n=1 Tax=Candidatus Propionivibrio dominans TaxID=2954373 RepID=A0A9D7IDE3_9RHOO|nr:hypothetical protein [Candidatus Propionivibrio dominans]
MTKTRSQIASTSSKNAIVENNYLKPPEYKIAVASHKPQHIGQSADRYTILISSPMGQPGTTLVFDRETDEKQRTIEINKRMAAWINR